MSLYYQLSSIATILGLLIILALVANKNFRSKINQCFFIFGSAVLLYTLIVYATVYIQSDTVGLTTLRLALIAANFIPLTFLAFSYAFIGRKKIINGSFLGIAFATLVIAALSFSPQTIGAVSHHIYGDDLAKTGPLLWLTLLNFVLVSGYSMYLLIGYGRKSDKITRSQVNIIVLTTTLVVSINLLTQIVLPELHMYTLGDVIGGPSILLFVGGIGYTILRHKLFDVRTVAFRTIGFVATLMIVVGIFSFLMIVPTSLLFSNVVFTRLENIYLITAAIVLALLFNPLKELLRKLTDTVFFQASYNPEELVNEISKILASEIRLGEMSKQVTEVLCKQMNVKEIDVIVLDKGKIYFESGNYFKSILPDFQKDLDSLKDSIVVTDELEIGPEQKMLEYYKIQVVAQLKVRDEKIGYILFSNRNRDLPYLKKDLLVTSIVSDELAVAIQNSRAYDQIKEFNAGLQRKVEESTSQLIMANDELKKAAATKDDFVSMVSHQLGTPLTVMEGFLTLISQGFYSKDPAKSDEAIKKALSRTRVMKNIVFDLLNLSRMSAGKFFLDISPVNLNETVREEVTQLEMEAKDKNVTLTYHPPASPVPILELDEAKTRQAIMNLINNAIFYSPNGKVDVYLSSDRNNVVFKVLDNGIGVPEDQKSHLFTKFFRADNAKRESPNGTGIGLYLVKRVVEDQHGQIIFSSHESEGSTFGFYLPVLAPEQT